MTCRTTKARRPQWSSEADPGSKCDSMNDPRRNPNASPAEKSRKGRLGKFSLRSLFVLVTAVAVALWLFVLPAVRQKRAIDYFERIGGTVIQSEGRDVIRRWLGRILGHEYALDAVELDLSGTRISDQGLAYLQDLEGLRSLSLYGTSVTDAGLVHLAPLTGLQKLWLDRTDITDAGLAHLAPLQALEELWLDRSKVSDAGIERLAKLSALEGLSLSGLKVSDAGLAHLERLTGLTWLSLSETKITDAGLAHIEPLHNLTWLSLLGTNVSDDVLKHLEVLKALTVLWLDSSRVSAEGKQKLRKALPHCTIGGLGHQ